MNDFRIWFSLGLDHLLEPGALDHILFLCLLSIQYSIKQWKHSLSLLIGFTIGHSLSMLISVMWKIAVPASLIELLIALSILITAFFSLTTFKQTAKKIQSILFIVVFFGTIHGLGFSLQLRSLLGAGDQFLLPLLYFNVGLECAQIIIVLAFMLFSLILTGPVKISAPHYKIFVICSIGSIALYIVVLRLWQLF